MATSKGVVLDDRSSPVVLTALAASRNNKDGSSNSGSSRSATATAPIAIAIRSSKFIIILTICNFCIITIYSEPNHLLEYGVSSTGDGGGGATNSASSTTTIL